MDAPHLASGAVPADVASFFEPPYREWWNAMGAGKNLEYVGLDESLASIDAFVAAHGPFDGVLGFSQGATLTGMLAAAGLAQGKGPFATDAGTGAAGTSAGTTTASPTFALMISGMLARTERARALYAAGAEAAGAGTGTGTGVSATGASATGAEAGTAEAEEAGAEAGTPSLHIIGEADRVLPPALSQRAAALPFFVHPVVVRHERGHVVPRLTGEALEQVRAFLTQRQQQRLARLQQAGSTQQTQTPSAAL
jgi:pimeloyl-ACP methyl ester carboxylesterase